MQFSILSPGEKCQSKKALLSVVDCYFPVVPDLNPRSSRTSSRRCRIGKRETMKSAFFVTIFVIVGGVAILLAVPAEEKAPVIKIQPPKWFPDYGDPVVPQIEEVPPQEVVVPEPLVIIIQSPRPRLENQRRAATCMSSARGKTSSRN